MHVEGGLPGAPRSVDSGYCSATSAATTLSVTTTLLGEHGAPQEAVDWPLVHAALSFPGLGSAASSDGEARVLRRRSSVVELGARYRGALEDELLDADDEGSRGSSFEGDGLGILQGRRRGDGNGDVNGNGRFVRRGSWRDD